MSETETTFNSIEWILKLSITKINAIKYLSIPLNGFTVTGILETGFSVINLSIPLNGFCFMVGWWCDGV